jgi:hypothetical protein
MELRLLDIEATTPDDDSLAEWVGGRCPHLPVDDRLLSLGYRFYNLGDSELPPFFSRRFRAGLRTAAATLLGGVDPATGDGVLDGCYDADDAARAVSHGRGGHWIVRLTYGARTVSLEEVAGPIGARDPKALQAFAGELRALGLATREACRTCCDADGVGAPPLPSRSRSRGRRRSAHAEGGRHEHGCGAQRRVDVGHSVRGRTRAQRGPSTGRGAIPEHRDEHGCRA